MNDVSYYKIYKLLPIEMEEATASTRSHGNYKWRSDKMLCLWALIYVCLMPQRCDLLSFSRISPRNAQLRMQCCRPNLHLLCSFLLITTSYHCYRSLQIRRALQRFLVCRFKWIFCCLIVKRLCYQSTFSRQSPCGINIEHWRNCSLRKN